MIIHFVYFFFFSSLIFLGWLFVTYGIDLVSSIDTEVLHSGIVPKPKLWYRAIPSLEPCDSNDHNSL